MEHDAIIKLLNEWFEILNKDTKQDKETDIKESNNIGDE